MRFHFFQDGIIDVIDPETAYAKTVDRKIVLLFFTFSARAGGLAAQKLNSICWNYIRNLDDLWMKHFLFMQSGNTS